MMQIAHLKKIKNDEIKKKEREINADSLFNKMNELINKIIMERNTNKEQFTTLIKENKYERDTFISQIRTERIINRTQLYDFMREMGTKRETNRVQFNTFINEMKYDRKLSKDHHDELVGILSNNLSIQKNLSVDIKSLIGKISK